MAQKYAFPAFGVFVYLNIELPDLHTEFRFRTSKSGGKGGQHVNKTESRVELLFSPAGSDLLTEFQKNKLLDRWAGRLDEIGDIRFVEDGDRSQIRNREEVVKKFYRALRIALREEKKRKKTKVPAAVKRKRAEGKQRRSDIKSARRKPEW